MPKRGISSTLNRLILLVSRTLPLVVLLLAASQLLYGVRMAFAVVALTATKTDSLVVDGNSNSQADPGDTLGYTVTITNSGSSDTTNAGFSDTIDPNTSLVGGSVKTTPIARNDSGYSTVGNVQLTVPAASSVLNNDNDPDGSVLTLTGVTGCADVTAPFVCPTKTANGGDVTLNADGSFTYNPAPGFSGTDTFTYTVQDTDGNADPATATISVGQVVWFINNTAAGSGDGRFTSPFNSVANFNSLAADDPGDYIFVYQGSGAYSDTLTLLNNQQLIGNGVALTIAPNLNIAAASRPTTSNVALASGNTVRGLNVSAGSGAGISGGSVGSLTINNVSVTNTNGSGVSLSSGALAVTLDRVSASGGANGIFLSNTTGSFTVNGDGTNTALGGNASGGTISNMSGADGATAGIGVYLSNAQNVTLRRMTINGTNQNFGIRGSSVTNFTLEYSTVSGVNGTSTVNREGSVIFDNLFATNAITSSIISGAIEDNLRVENTTGTLTAFNLTNSIIQNNSTVSGNIGFRFATATSGVTMTGTVSGTKFQGNRTIAIQADASNGTVNFTASNNTIIAGAGGNNQGNQGIEVDVANNGVMTFAVSDNKIGTDGITNQPLLNTGINIFNGTLVTSGTPASITGTVTNNTVYNAGAGMSGFGIRLFNQGYGTMNANVSNNTVNNVGLDYGIFAEVSSNSGTANATGSSSIAMVGNTSNVLAGALDAIRVQARGRSTMCTRISGNASSTHGTGFFGLEIRQAAQTINSVTYQATFNLEGLTSGLQTDHTTIVNYLNSQNPAVIGGADEIHSNGITGVPVNNCSSIPVAALPDTNNQLAQTSQGTASVVAARPFAPSLAASRANVTHALTSAFAALSDGASQAVKSVISASSISGAYASGATVNVTLGNLDPGQQVTITFRVTIADPVTPSTTNQVCNQGTVTGDGGLNVLTDDPAVGGASDPTCTPLADEIPPDTTIDSTPANPSNSSSASFTFSGTDNPGGSGVASFECKLDLGAFAACTSPQSYTGLADGSHTFQVRAIDGAGNVDQTPATFTWSIDATPPAVTINQDSGQADPTSSSPIHFTAVFTEPVTGFGDSAGDVSLSGTAGATAAVVTEIAPNDGTTYDVSVSGMSADGSVIASIPPNAASDAAGNGNTASTSTDNTVTFVLSVPDLTIVKSHTGDFHQAQSGAQYTITVSNNGTGPTSGTVTVVDTLPAGLTGTAISGTGWTCNLGTLTCTRSDALAAGSSYPDVTLTVDVAGNASASLTNSATVSGGGETNTANNTATDPTTVIQDSTPPETFIDSSPADPSYSTGASFTFSGTDDQTPSGSLTFECKLDIGTFAACTSPKSYSGLSLGIHTFEVRAIDLVGNVDPTPASFTWQIKAQTSLLYNGAQIVNVGNTFKPAAKLTSPAAACVSGQQISFSLDRNPLTGVVGSYSLGTATTGSTGQATMSALGTTNWLEGIYDITADFAGTANCEPSSYTATLTVAAPGTSASGGGWYTLSGSGRINFGFTVRKVDNKCTTNCAYKGQLLLINNGKWRLKGTLDTYSKTSTGQGASSGTGDLYWWDPTLNGGLGDWVLAQSGVSFTINFYDSGKTGKSSTDSFGINIQYLPVPPQPGSLPNSKPIVLKGGNITVK